MSFEGVSVLFKNYKAFGDEWVGFQSISPFNLIIGRNNSGKSALLDLIDLTVSKASVNNSRWHKGNETEYRYSIELNELTLRQCFRADSVGGPLTSRNSHWDVVGSQLLGGRAIISKTGVKRTLVGFDRTSIDSILLTRILSQFRGPPDSAESTLNSMLNPFASESLDPFANVSVKRLSAERDIRPESSSPPLSLDSNGAGATNIITQLMTEAVHNEEIIRVSLLRELNNILRPDIALSDITTKRTDNVWEIYLRHDSGVLVPISNSGSGLKTIIIVLLLFIVIPIIENNIHKNYIYSIEEPENNLHPALLRRLVQFILRQTGEDKATVFMTTHSNVAIDILTHSPRVQIVHVINDGRTAKASKVSNYIGHRAILDDLDVRPSDLLQSNCIIWVEGPSDRTYVNRWIYLRSEGTLQEGLHYQCVFYGGRLLAHLFADDPTENSDELIHILRLNRHAAIIIDSDKRANTDNINATKRRIAAEFEKMRGLCWITQGREIENYVSMTAIQALYPKAKRFLEQYEDFARYLDTEVDDTGEEGRKFERGKGVFAIKLADNLNKSNFDDVLDLSDRLNDLVSFISRCNGEPES